MKSHRAARKKSPARSHQRGFTPQQIVILILLAVTCTAILAVTGYWLFSGGLDAPSKSISGQAEPQASILPPTWTAPAVIETPPAATPAPAQAIPALPAGCAQAGTAFQQGIVRGIIDGSTIEVQDGENILRVGYAGITVTQDLPAAKARASCSKPAGGAGEGYFRAGFHRPPGALCFSGSGLIELAARTSNGIGGARPGLRGLPGTGSTASAGGKGSWQTRRCQPALLYPS